MPQLLLTAESNLSVPMIEAYLVEEEGGGDDGGHDTVYEHLFLSPTFRGGNKGDLKS